MSAAEFVPESGGVAELRAAAKDCHGCELWEPATQTVFGAGSPGARIMLVGEQPGDVEDQRGLPFVGPAGQLLQKGLDEAGADRSMLYVTNAVKHFRFTWQGKRRLHQTPDAGNVNACRPWLEAEIARVDPELIVVLGATAGKALLGSGFRVTRDRGVVMERETPVGARRFFATIHPSAILRMDADVRDQGYADFVTDLRAAVAAVEV
ncbi:UdgX family uracil-DNA binding protein [Microlunatus antarcticus]|uniref:Type-4 uracil-DNA glycosylase n=1 Tax=Microlunatus antarcticus TaxID=53388 RepID=A0A7W5JV36_9ACTN|nr:UdgX family uracil-DNA binding protein [Microlunatus antarcticus]MBB3326818.1 DNA polymerase [Microlunatus antarcticus]